MNRIVLRQYVVKALCVASLLATPSLAMAGKFEWADQLFGPNTQPQILRTVSSDLKGESYRELRENPTRYGVVLTRAFQLSARFSADMREGSSLPQRLARWVENAPQGVLEKELVRQGVAAFSKVSSDFEEALDAVSDKIKIRLGLSAPAAAAAAASSSASSTATRPSVAPRQPDSSVSQPASGSAASSSRAVVPALSLFSSTPAAADAAAVPDVISEKVVHVSPPRPVVSGRFAWAARDVLLSEITSATILAQVSEDLRNDSFDGLMPERYAPVLARALRVVYKFRADPEAQNPDLIRRLLRWIEAAPASVRADENVTQGILSLIEGRGAHADFSARWALLQAAEQRAASRPATPRWGKNDDTEAASAGVLRLSVPDLEAQMARMLAGEKVGSSTEELDLFVERITEHLSSKALDQFISGIIRAPFDPEVPVAQRGWGAWVPDTQIARPSVLGEIARDFKGRSAEFNSRNPQKYAKVLTRALDLAYEFNAFIETNLAHAYEKAVEIHSATNLGAVPGSAELIPALVEWINAAPEAALENDALQEAIGKLAHHNVDFSRALRGVEFNPFGRS